MIKRIFIKILHKSKLNIILYKLIKKRFNNVCEHFTEADVKKAWDTLSSFYKDVKSTAITKNKLNIHYDVQIIIPVYNVEKYIIECIESILSQKINYSYIVTIINDGSPDSSRELLKKYESNAHIEIIDQENKGFSGARNRGLKIIKGRYITFLDSDDRLTPNSITAMMNAADKYHADIVQGGYNSISERDGKILNSYRGVPAVSDTDDSFLKGFPWGKLFKAELFEEIHFPEKYWFEDTICAYLLFPLSKTKIGIDDIVYDYRKNHKGITFTSRGKLKTLDTLYITNSLLNDAQNFEYAKSDAFYTRQFQQIKNNQKRISTIKNKEIQKATFIIHCDLIERYFCDNKLITDNYAYKEMENAIKTHNFILYKWIADLL